MIKFNLGLRETDTQRLASILRRCPDLDNTTDAIREAIKRLDEQTAQEAEARKQARKAQKNDTRNS